MKHTPGPWILDLGVSSNVVLIDSNATNGAVGEIVDCRNRADARLIAAAPELLEALVELSKSFVDTYFDDPRSDEEIDGHQEFWENKARAAIAKATGEQA
jgi:hypothetical protein